MKLFFEHSLSSENLPYDESVPSLKPEEQLMFRPNSISGNPSENSVDAFSSLFSVVISDVEENAFNDQINLAEEFNNFAAAIIGRKLASVQNVKLWIDLSEASADFYLDSFTFAEISNFIALFLNEIENNTPYKFPCLAILVKWILNLRRPFFDAFGYNVFGYSEIEQIFENELKCNPNKELFLATNILRMPMI